MALPCVPMGAALEWGRCRSGSMAMADGQAQAGSGQMELGLAVRSCAASVADGSSPAAAARALAAEAGDPTLPERRRQARRRVAEERVGSLERAGEELRRLQEKAGAAASPGGPRVSTTDPAARVMEQGNGGYAPSYSVQTTPPTPPPGRSWSPARCRSSAAGWRPTKERPRTGRGGEWRSSRTPG
jgi:hypothetical protein